MEKIAGLTISEHNNSKRIINIDIENEIISLHLIQLYNYLVQKLYQKVK